MADASLRRLENSCKAEIDAYNALQADIQKSVSARQQFLQQLNENEMVLKELNLLEEDANVFKLIGPALVKQDPVEATSNVQKRLEFINGELSRLEGKVKSQEEKLSHKQQQVLRLQQEMQKLRSPAG